MPRRSSIAKAAIAALALSAAAAAGAQVPRVVVLLPENATGDRGLDYVGPVAHGLLLFDLSRARGVEVVDRAALDAVLRERELSLSALASNPARIGSGGPGGIAVADFVLASEYSLLGGSLRFTSRLVDVPTAKSTVFSANGSSENAVHSIAEKIALRLSGGQQDFAVPGPGLSLLSMRDDAPGSIAVHSPLADARIYVDGAFVGYTTGDRRKPFVVAGADPGERVVSTELPYYGIVSMPEASIARWSQKVLVRSGRTAVVEDSSVQVNYFLQNAMNLARINATVEPGRSFEAEKAFAFEDRDGRMRSGRFIVSVVLSPLSIKAVFESDGETKELTAPVPEKGAQELAAELGLVSFSFKVERRARGFGVSASAERTDLRAVLVKDE